MLGHHHEDGSGEQQRLRGRTDTQRFGSQCYYASHIGFGIVRFEFHVKHHDGALAQNGRHMDTGIGRAVTPRPQSISTASKNVCRHWWMLVAGDEGRVPGARGGDA